MKVLLFGSTGYLGQSFLKLYPNAVCPHIDIADQQAVSLLLDAEKPDVIINAAGKTGRPNIDWCEDHKEETLRANVLGPMILNEECLKRGLYWVHLSSGCIYSGDNEGRGFSENDRPNFEGSFYSRTKIWSESMLLEFPNVLILRLRMPFDDSTSDRSLLMKLSKYARLNDQQNSITYLPDLLVAAEKLILQKKAGLYNVVNPGTISAYEIMEIYKKVINPTHTIEKFQEDDAQKVTKAPRSNCMLSIQKLENAGIQLLPVHQAVEHAWSVISSIK